jgi:hypothetical protein
MLLALRVIIAARWLRRFDIFAYVKVLNGTVYDMNSTTCTYMLRAHVACRPRCLVNLQHGQGTQQLIRHNWGAFDHFGVEDFSQRKQRGRKRSNAGAKAVLAL